MTISEIKKQAKASLKGKWGTAVLLTFLLLVINAILPGIFEVYLSGGFIEWFKQEETPLAADIMNAVITIGLMPLNTAAFWFYLSVVRRENPQIADVFAIYKDGTVSLKVIGASILVMLFTILWALLLIIPGIIKSLAYSQTFFLLKDHPECTILEAIRESDKRMKGYKWKYFLLNVSFIGWGILCIVTLGIGFLWLAPYITASTATFYKEVVAVQD